MGCTGSNIPSHNSTGQAEPRDSAVGQLTKEDIELLHEKTKLSPDKIKHMHKVFMKACPSGNLTRSKFSEIYKNMFPHGKSGPFFDHMFRTFDKDNSGTLSFVEFMLAAHLTESGSAKDILDITFRLYDIDGNQKIDEHEIAEILQALYILHSDDKKNVEDICKQAAKELIEKMDSNGDGVLSKEEFIDGCLENPELCKALAGQ